MLRGHTWLVGLAILTASCNSLFGIEEASELEADASAGGSAGSAGVATGGNAGSDSGVAPGGGGIPSGGSAGVPSGGSAGMPVGGGSGGSVPCSSDVCPFEKIQCCQSTNVTSAVAVGNSIQSEVCEADPFTCAVCRQGGGACSAFCQNVGSELAVCLDCIIENCSGLYVGVKAACGSACSDFDACMAGCGS